MGCLLTITKLGSSSKSLATAGLKSTPSSCGNLLQFQFLRGTSQHYIRSMSSAKGPRFIDIGVNLTDPVFRGRYHGKRKHEDDLKAVMERCQATGVSSMMITGGNLKESKEALTLAAELGVYSTAGCHPTRSSEFEKHPNGPSAYLSSLDDFISAHSSESKPRIAAIGECGLDYDRLHFASVETQKAGFRLQLGLAKKHHLPLFLHSRAAHSDFVEILREAGFGDDGGRAIGGRGGVVHSFTGTVAEVEEVVKMGFHISINGCGLKTTENLEAVKAIPLNRLLLETDAPWCSMTSAHASHAHLQTMPEEMRLKYLPPAVKPEKFIAGKTVKGRNEPISIGAVAWVVAQVQGISFETVAEAAWKNTVELLGTMVVPAEGDTQDS